MKINKKSFVISLPAHIQKLLLFQMGCLEQSYEDTASKLLHKSVFRKEVTN